jgi:hypothetical protein
MFIKQKIHISNVHTLEAERRRCSSGVCVHRRTILFGGRPPLTPPRRVDDGWVMVVQYYSGHLNRATRVKAKEPGGSNRRLLCRNGFTFSSEWTLVKHELVKVLRNRARI